MYKDVLKRILALTLCTCIIAAGVNWTVLNAAAEDDTQNVTEVGQDTDVSAEDAQGLQGMQMNMLPGEETEETNDQTNQEVAQETEEPVNAVQEQKNRMLYGMDVFTYRVGAGYDLSATNITILNADDIEYDGTAKTPTVRVLDVDANQLLVNGRDFTVTYTDNVDAGTATVTIYPTSTSQGSNSTTFTIKQRSIENASIGNTNITEYTLPDQVFNGQTTIPTLNLKDGNTLLYQDTHYTVNSTIGETEGTKGRKVTLTVEGIKNYNGSVALSYYITPKNITDEDVTVNCLKSVGYTGSAIEPPVSVYYNTNKLEKGVDYEVIPLDSDDLTSMGEKNVRVLGIGNYTGYTDVTFSIVGQSIKNAEITLIDAENLVYTGKPIQPKVEIKCNGNTLKEKVDYTLSYSNNVNASDGSTLATVTATGINNYGDEASTTFVIHPVNLSELTENTDYIISGTKNWTYTGEAIKPPVSVIVKEILLKEGTDYTLNYLEEDENNVINVGEDKILFITGTGNYSGSIIWKFNINKKDIKNATVTVDEYWQGIGTLPRPNVVVMDGEHLLREGIDYNITSYTDVDGVDLTETSNGMKGIVHIEARDDSNYKGTTVGNFLICTDVKDDEKVTVEAISDKTYSGKEYKPVPKIKDKSTDKYLEEGTDFTVEYPEDCINQGTKTIKVNGIGKYAGTRTMNYTINQKKLDDYDITCEGPAVEYTGEDTFTTAMSKMTVTYGTETLVYGRDYMVEKVAGGSDYTQKGKQYIKITAITDGDYNNYTGSKEDNNCYYTITGKSFSDAEGNPVSNLSISGIEGVRVPYDNGNPVFPQADEDDIVIEWDEQELVRDTDYKLSYENNTEAGTATVVIKGRGNYTGEVRVNYSIVYNINDVTVEMLDETGNVVTGNKLQYTGEVIQPTVRLKYKNTVLIAGTDYDIAYNNTNSMNVGDGYTVSITGKGLYTGTRSDSYSIVPRELSTVSKLTIESVQYDGQTHKFYPKYKLGDYILQNNKDFRVLSWTNAADDTDHGCIKAGTILVEAEGLGNFTGTDTFTYEITTRDIAEAYYVGPSAIKYDGTSHRPETMPEVLEYNGTPVSTDDYTIVTCIDSGDSTATKNSQCINAGIVTVVVQGKNSFSGTLEFSYEIQKGVISQADVSFTGASEVAYNHEVQNPQVQILSGGVAMKPENYTCTYYRKDTSGGLTEVSECKDAGTYIVRFEGKGNYEGTADLTYKILPIDINLSPAYEITYEGITDQGYTGSAIIPPNLKVYEKKKGDVGAVKRELVADTDYIVLGENNINQGTATITIKGSGNYTGEKTATFNITRKDITEKTDGSNYDIDLKEVQSVQYTGEVLTPDLVLMQGDRVLIQGVDYEVTYVQDTNKRIGPAYGTITGIGNYTGTRTFTEKDPIFNVVSCLLNEAYEAGDLTIEIPPYTYDGKSHDVVSDTVVRYGTTTLKKGTDYVIETPQDRINAGEQPLVITGAGNYGGTINTTFTIRPRNIMQADLQTFIEGASMEDIITETPYVGKAIEPKVVIRDTLPGRTSATKLVADRDYTVTYVDNQYIGMAKVVISFIGNYTAYNDYDASTKQNTYTVEFEILPKNITDADVHLEEMEDQSYTGSEIFPEPVLTYGDITLQKDVDYTVDYGDNNIDVGRVYVTITGINSCYGELETSFIITRKALDSEGITIADIPDQAYNGEAITPPVVVDYNGTPLTEGEDYELTWEDNQYPGVATVTATGKGNYTSSISKTFNIRGDLEQYGAVEPIEAQCYTGDLIEPEVTVTFDGRELVKGTDYKVTYKKNIGVGVAEVTIKGAGVYDGTIMANFNISYDIGESEVQELANRYTYTGNEITPVVKVIYKGKVLTEGTDYEVSYKDNINVGTGTVILKGLGEYAGTCEKDFEIISKSITTCTLGRMKEVTYNGIEKKPTITLWNNGKTLVKNTDYTVEYENNKEPGWGKAIVTGKGDYSGTMKIDFAIKVAEPIGLKTVATSDSTIKLSWRPGGVVSGYELYCDKGGNKWEKIATVTTTSYTDKKLTASTKYRYRVRAYVKDGFETTYSAYSNEISTNTVPETPRIEVSSPRTAQAMIVWTKQKAADGYEVYQSTKKDGNYTMIRDAKGSNCTTYTKTKLTSNGTYYYKVRAYKTINGKKVYGQYSVIKSIKVK